ncbi:MAG TPA: hypothetical protein ENJ08_03555 [Gammaproteobacteria bacterium]|nr:hypothetical protein [Gammaproteobacteria bacterium]
MCSNDVLCFKVLSILKNTDIDLGLYDLMQQLESAGYDLSGGADDDFNVRVFRKNFIVMNALYQLQADLTGTGYYLFISSLKVAILQDNASKKREMLANKEEEPENMAFVESLAGYYLDWNNFNSVDKDDVDRLLKGFWTRFAKYNENQCAKEQRCEALKKLGLASSADQDEIRSAYRRLVAGNHPDRGGDSQQFIEIREAYLILKLM